MLRSEVSSVVIAVVFVLVVSAVANAEVSANANDFKYSRFDKTIKAVIK